MNGHVDVVSPEPVSEWKHPPWGAEIDHGKLFGRGSMDMKGGISAMIYAMRAVAESGIKLRGDVILQSVVEEEYRWWRNRQDPWSGDTNQMQQ